MKVLWINNSPLPPLCRYLGIETSPKEGWVFSSLKRLRKIDCTIEIAVATVISGDKFLDVEVEGIKYYCLPLCGKKNIEPLPHLHKFWRKVKAEFNPDVIHIHGSEFTHGYEWCNANGYSNVVVSFQGIISAISRYYSGAMPHSFFKYITFRDWIKRDWISNQVKKWNERGNAEKEFLSKIPYYIGRTEWDKSHGWAINPDAVYFYGGETLRDSFYKAKWDYSKCEKFTIFASQGFYPLKGVDQIIKALPLIERHYPNVKLRIAGIDIINLPWYRIGGYGKYLKKLCKQLGVEDKVKFVGILNESQMLEEYLKANVFVCSSSIENSPNSLAEAQILRMPHLASFVGGVPEITNMNEKVLYRFEEYEMMAKKICEIFSDKANFMPHEIDEQRYDAQLNANLLLESYKVIANKNINNEVGNITYGA